MKHYPRKLNRLFLFIVGLVFLAVGVLTAAAAMVPSVQTTWAQQGENFAQRWTEISRSAVVIKTDVSWLTIALIALGVIAVILTLALILSQGGGRTSRLDDPHADEFGSTVAELGFINELLATHAEKSQWIHSVSARSYEHKHQPQLSISVSTFKGASPREMADLVREMVKDLDVVLGRQIPVHVHIGSNWQSAIASRKRVK